MRTAFFTSAAAAALSILACAACSGQQAKASAGPAQTAQVQGTEVSLRGCARPAPEKASCTVMRGPGGVVYDISSVSPAPDPSRGVNVQLSGIDTGKASDCGKVLDDVKWNYLSLRCAAAQPTEVATLGATPAQ